jgi:hypothetical protein
MVKQWTKYGLIFLSIIAIVAFILPTSYSLGLLDSAAIGLRYLIDLLYFLLQLILLIISIPLVWLLSFFTGETEGSGSVMPAITPPMLPTSQSESPAWLEVLRSLIFWIVALAAIGYVIKTYLDDHPDIVRHLKSLKPLRILRGFLASTWGFIKSMIKSGIEMLPTDARIFATNKSDSSKSAFQIWLGVRNLSARERILYYYLNILNQAQKKGCPAPPGRDPL